MAYLDHHCKDSPVDAADVVGAEASVASSEFDSLEFGFAAECHVGLGTYCSSVAAVVAGTHWT